MTDVLAEYSGEMRVLALNGMPFEARDCEKKSA
jgi:hypothetical protein